MKRLAVVAAASLCLGLAAVPATANASCTADHTTGGHATLFDIYTCGNPSLGISQNLSTLPVAFNDKTSAVQTPANLHQTITGYHDAGYKGAKWVLASGTTLKYLSFNGESSIDNATTSVTLVAQP